MLKVPGQWKGELMTPSEKQHVFFCEEYLGDPDVRVCSIL